MDVDDSVLYFVIVAIYLVSIIKVRSGGIQIQIAAFSNFGLSVITPTSRYLHVILSWPIVFGISPL